MVLTASLAAPYGLKEGQVNTVNLGAILTERLTQCTYAAAKHDSIRMDEAVLGVKQDIPLGRIMKLGEIANAVASVVSA